MSDSLHDYYLNALSITPWVIPAVDPWAILEKSCSKCTACGLARSRTQTVFGRGSVSAKVLIVGEAPGFHEDLQGEPFVGRAGQLLDKMLAAIGLGEAEVYITNILKCRPPENRDPTLTEVTSCTPFLEQQVELLKPSVILALGKVAANYLLGSEATLSALRGRWQTFKTRQTPLMVTYHPAYLLRNPASKGLAYQDLLKVQDALQRA
jgi:uracil-DNA glycosylase family 4